eukprot:s13520_g1.t1
MPLHLDRDGNGFDLRNLFACADSTRGLLTTSALAQRVDLAVAEALLQPGSNSIGSSLRTEVERRLRGRPLLSFLRKSLSSIVATALISARTGASGTLEAPLHLAMLVVAPLVCVYDLSVPPASGPRL